MKLTNSKHQNLMRDFSLKNSWKAWTVLFIGLVLTFEATYFTEKNVEEIANQDFEFICNDLKIKIDTRLRQHAQLLRSGAALFAASDTVTQEEWRRFNESEKISKNLPGIQGVGYSLIIPKNQLPKHIQFFRKNGFSDYRVVPLGDREIYTSIIYLEPFSGRNLTAFGYDMFSEPIRRKAMEVSRDSNLAMLSGKVILVQETEEDRQVGALMYVPVYRNGMPTNNVEERRAAIKGWVYSPYRMDDLMNGILGNWDLPNKNRIHLRIYDTDNFSDEKLLYDSQRKEKLIYKGNPNLYLKLPIEFNGKKWTLLFTGHKENLSILHGEILIVLISGITISLLLFAFSVALINTRLRARQIQQLNKQLKKLNTDKDRFISILGHDLRSPFNAFLGLSELLTENIRKYDINEIEELVKNINESAQNTYNLLDDLLMWTSAESGKIPFEPQKLNFTVICKDIIKIFTPNAHAKNIAINLFAAEEINIFADIDLLKTVLRNLVSNAIKFTHKGGQIDIYAEINEIDITITVADNGIGIKSQDLTRLFDISQFHTTTGTEEEEGTGFGLLICKDFVEKNGGKIWAESMPGNGSKFKFTLQMFNSNVT
jgi:signal transduction histidine kinase